MSAHAVSEFIQVRAERLGLRIEYRGRWNEEGQFFLVEIESGYDVFPGMQFSLIPDALRCFERELHIGDAKTAWSDLFRRDEP